jgi:nucleoid-associated protein YgaU
MAGDKPRPDFSDVTGGGSSTAPKAPEPAPPPDEVYTVVAGDSLSKIAKRVYGDANQWRRIFEANRDQIQNPDLIRPGQKLKIPAARA